MGSLSTIPHGYVEADLTFTARPSHDEPLFTYADEVPPGQPQNNFKHVTHKTLVRDIRGSEDTFSLDTHAFQFLHDLPPSSEKSFTDDASIQKNYYPEVEQLLLSTIPGVTRVVIFDHTIRRPPSPDAPDGQRSPVYVVHIDQTPYSAERRVHRHLPPEDVEDLLKGRYRIINVWRTLNSSPLEDSPLAFASSASTDDKDIIPVENRYPTYKGQAAAIAHNPEQEWYYASGMTGDERILLECFDSAASKKNEDGTWGAVKGGRVPHTAFMDPRTRDGAEGRESIEIRALVFGP